MLTLPLYLQIVIGLSPTASGFATLPMMVGLMIASIGSGQIIVAHRPVPDLPGHGHAVHCGRLPRADVPHDRQAALVPHDRDVPHRARPRPADADAHAGEPELGRAAPDGRRHRRLDLLPPDRWNPGRRRAALGAVLRAAGQHRQGDCRQGDAQFRAERGADPDGGERAAQQGDHEAALDADRHPDRKQIQGQLTSATPKARAAADAAVTQQVTAAVNAQVAAGVIPSEAAASIIDQQVVAATPVAEAAALAAVAKAAHASVNDGTVEVNWANASQRGFYVDKLTPTLVKELKKGDSKANSSSNSSTSDTSFLERRRQASQQAVHGRASTTP